MIVVLSDMPQSCTLAIEALRERSCELIDKAKNKGIWDIVNKYESELSEVEEQFRHCAGSITSVYSVAKELGATKKRFADRMLREASKMIEKAGGTTDGWEAHRGFYAKVISTDDTRLKYGAEKDLHHMNFDQCKELAKKIGFSVGRLPEIKEVDIILGGKPHPYGEHHDSWMPCYNEGEKDWVQTGDPNRYCQSHLDEHRHYPGWGEETVSLGEEGREGESGWDRLMY